MADKKYVAVDATVKDAFDNKYKSSLPKVMKAAIEKAINKSSKLTTKPPADKKAPGFYIAASLVSLTNDDGVLEVEVSLALASWPGKSIFGAAKGSGKLNVDEADDKDVERLVSQVLEDLTENKVNKALENQ